MANTKTMLSRKVYTYENGETGRSAKPGWQKLTFEFLAPNKDEKDQPIILETVSVDRSLFPAEVLDCAIGHGLSQKLGDALAGIAGKAAKEGVSPDKERGFVDFAFELISDAIDNLKEGVWVAEGEGSSGSGSVTILYEAIVAAFAKAGTELTDEQKASIREKLKGEDYRNAAKARKDIAAEVEKIKAARAAERAKKAAAQAKQADDLEALDELI